MGYRLTVYHLYPDLLNLYGDKGNIATSVSYTHLDVYKRQTFLFLCLFY